MAFLPIEQILRQRKAGERLALLLRHAERRHILSTDTDYGAHVRITENGFEQARSVGNRLAGFSSVLYAASPVMRCRESASAIAQARGDFAYDTPEKIPVIPELGDFYIADQAEYLRLLSSGFFQSIFEYLEKGHLFGFLPMAEGSEDFLGRIRQWCGAELNVFVSHDAWIVPFLTHFTDVHFRPDRWLNFLSGAAVFFPEEMGAASPRIIPVTGLGDGYLYFSNS